MPLNNSQYDEIIRTYDARQLSARHLLENRRQEVYSKCPRLREIDEAIAAASVEHARKLLDGDENALDELRTRIADYRKEHSALLSSLGYSEDYFTPVYTCPDCKDTGYIGNARCHCFEQAAIDLVYTQSNIKEILKTENFSTFSFDYYSDDEINPATGLSSLATVRDAVAKCHEFIADFDTPGSNLYIYGDTGIGKTFLSNCVAKELMDKGYSVIYFTSFQLFDTLSKGVFKKDEDAIAAHRNIFDCDLLIIDDLGTELANSFTTSQLFLCLNERILRRKSTIISTNLGLRELADIYSERVLSRISSNYTIIKLFGTDIRILKRHP
jgi:DNA replication protein DnaC